MYRVLFTWNPKRSLEEDFKNARDLEELFNGNAVFQHKGVEASGKVYKAKANVCDEGVELFLYKPDSIGRKAFESVLNGIIGYIRFKTGARMSWEKRENVQP